MPIHMTLFFWRIPSISPAEFKKHYETVHMPLLHKLAGTDFPTSHTRHYITRPAEPTVAGKAKSDNTAYPATVSFDATQEDFDYDCYTEVVFEDMEHMMKFQAYMQNEEVHADEKNFVAMERMKVVAVDEPCVTTRPAA